MLKNYMTIAFRHLGRQKVNTALHIIGLTIGMSVCLLIALFLNYELSFDTYHDKAERTYRVISVWKENENKNYHYSTPLPLASALRKEVSGLENVSLAHPLQPSIIEIDPQKRFKQDHMLVVEPEFLDIFKVEALQGDVYKALRQPYQAVLTETTAKKFFGNENPIGRTFKLGDEFDITVAAIIQDLPSNTHLPASMLLSFVANEKFLHNGLEGWSYVSGTETLVVVPEKYDLNNLKAQLKTMADKRINSNPGMPKFMRSDFDVQPLSEVHFNSAIAGGGGWVQSISTGWIWFFGIIGIAVLTLACINFMNLSTAQSLIRAKEVGVRKSIGAGRLNLIIQFLTEAWMLTFISGVLSIVLAQLFLPSINTLLDKEISFNLLQSSSLMFILFIGVILTGLLAGIYPAWVIAKFNPSITLKTGSMVAGNHRSTWLRKGLVVTQFTISVGLLMAVILIAQQVNFLRSKNLGFTKDNIINVEVKDPIHKSTILRNELNKIAQVKDISLATATPSNQGHWGTVMSKVGREDPNRKKVTMIFSDAQYCKMYGMKLLAGRFLEASDTNYISRAVPEAKQIMKSVVNEKLIGDLGFESNEAAIGERIWIGWNSGNVEIVGVVADFNTGPLHEAIKPTLITPSPTDYSQAGIKIEEGCDVPQTIAAIEAAWKTTYPDGIFDYKFLDQQIDAFYKAEERLFNLFKIFSGLAVFISCLGLWGLAMYAAESRTKEIGIRKVLGASVNSIVALLSKEFLLLVLLALLIATPLSWYGIDQWLKNYAYRTEMTWWIFGLTGFIAVLIAFVTVSSQAIRAAVSNPVDSLKSE